MTLYPRGYYPLRTFYQRNAPVIVYLQRSRFTRLRHTLFRFLTR